MPIREKSFRIGCGRYLQECNVLNRCGEEISRLGNYPLVIGGSTALAITRVQIESSIKQNCSKYKIVVHAGTCNEDDARALSELAHAEGFDVIVGVGGGVIMDFAKLTAYFASLPVVNIPTSSATCAAYTPLSVRYTKEGKTVGSLHFDRETNAVLVDTSIVAAQPTRLLLAGVFDALAKFVEIKQRFAGAERTYPLGLDWAYVLSAHSYNLLSKKTELCLSDIRDGKITDTVEEVIFACIAATGVISGIARGSNQTALAHKFYEMTRVLFHQEAKPYLHGEIVGIGLLLQNVFNGEKNENRALLEIMRKYRMPLGLTDIGISPSQRTLDAYFEKLKVTSAVLEAPGDAEQNLRETLEYLIALKRDA